MILHCNYEELQSLRAGARQVLDADHLHSAADAAAGGSSRHPSGLAVTEARRAGVEALLPQLDGDMTFQTLGGLRQVASAVAVIVDCLRAEMDVVVIATHAAHENAVAAYFDYAHALSVLGRLRELDRQMESMIEVVTGGRPNDASIQDFVFPD